MAEDKQTTEEETTDEKTTEELTEEIVDAEMLKLAEEEAIDEPTGDTPEDTDKSKDSEEPKDEIDEEEATAVAQKWLTERGYDVKLSGEAEAEVQDAKDTAKSQTAEEILSSLPNVDLDPAVIDLIDKRYEGDPLKRDAAFVQYASSVAMEAMASEKAKEAVAPILETQEAEQWQQMATATSEEIAKKAEVPEAAQSIAKIIIEAGPESKERYEKDPMYKRMMDALIIQEITKVASSLEEDDKKEIPPAEDTGGAKGEARPSDEGATGEIKEMVKGIRGDVANGFMTKKEGDALVKDLTRTR